MSNFSRPNISEARYPVYRSKHNGHIRYALTNAPGYEDEHPEDWEGYNSLAEAQGAQAKLEEATNEALGVTTNAALLNSPRTLQLAPEDTADLVASAAIAQAAQALEQPAPPAPPVTLQAPPPPPIPTIPVQ